MTPSNPSPATRRVADLSLLLRCAVSVGNLPYVRMFLADGADPSLPDDKGDTPAMISCSASRHSSIEQPEILAVLIAAGADLDARNLIGSTASMAACMAGDPRCLSLLIAAGCDLTLVDDRLNTACHHAAAHANPDCLRMLIAASCPLNSRARDGSTPAHIAAKFGRARSLEILAAAGADLSSKNDSFLDPLALAWKFHRADCARLIKAHLERAALEGCASHGSTEPRPHPRI